MSEAETQTAQSMTKALSGMSSTEKAVALAYVEGMAAMKQMQEQKEDGNAEA